MYGVGVLIIDVGMMPNCSSEQLASATKMAAVFSKSWRRERCWRV